MELTGEAVDSTCVGQVQRNSAPVVCTEHHPVISSSSHLHYYAPHCDTCSIYGQTQDEYDFSMCNVILVTLLESVFDDVMLGIQENLRL